MSGECDNHQTYNKHAYTSPDPPPASPPSLPTGEQPKETHKVAVAESEVILNLVDEEIKADNKQKKDCDQIGKKGSPAWDYFEKIKDCPVGKEKAKCSLCGVIIGCYSRNGTSAMMNHLRTAGLIGFWEKILQPAVL